MVLTSKAHASSAVNWMPKWFTRVSPSGSAKVSAVRWDVSMFASLSVLQNLLFVCPHRLIPCTCTIQNSSWLVENVCANCSGIFSVVSFLQGTAQTIPDVLNSPKSNIHFFYPVTFSSIQLLALFCFFNFLRNALEIYPRQNARMHGRLTPGAFLFPGITVLSYSFFNI